MQVWGQFHSIQLNGHSLSPCTRASQRNHGAHHGAHHSDGVGEFCTCVPRVQPLATWGSRG